MAAAISSNDGWVTELTKLIVPNSVAALATATPPSGVRDCSEPMGASITGILSRCPRKIAAVSILETSTRTRGRNVQPSKP
ncbi:MAG TPA: hypothetical protein VJ646_04415 [Candidatus Binatia bacterium]|nr:hypothetical protein [Candidatus Binatia bacterium]